MPITEKQRLKRSRCIGSSDMAAVLGCNPYSNAHDVYLSKKNLLDGFVENQAMYAGTILENSMLDFAEDKLGKIKRNQYRVNKDLYLGANIDGILVDGQIPVEVKTTGITGFPDQRYGDIGTNDVPEHVRVQCHVHMLCLSNKPTKCYVPALIGGKGLMIYTVDRDPWLCDRIEEAAVKFWEDHVLKSNPPEYITPTLETIKRRVREEGRVIEIDPEMVELWNELKEMRKEIDEDIEVKQAQILTAMGDAEIANIGKSRQLTYFKRGGKKTKAYRVLNERKAVDDTYE